MPGKNPKSCCEALEMLLRLRVQNDGKYCSSTQKLRTTSTFQVSINFRFGFFWVKTFKRLVVKGLKLCYPLRYRQRVERQTEIQQANGRCLCPELCQKKSSHGDF